MQTKFVMVKCKASKTATVADEIVQMIEVSEVYTMSGDYDLLLKCNLEANADIRKVVLDRIQTISGVENTFTLDTENWFA